MIPSDAPRCPVCGAPDGRCEYWHERSGLCLRPEEHAPDCECARVAGLEGGR